MVSTIRIARPQGLMPRALREDAGQGLVEYSMILTFVVVVAIAALTFLGSDLSQEFSNIANSM